MASDSVINGLVESLQCRKRLLELSSTLGLGHDARIRAALRTDEARIAELLIWTFDSKAAEEAVLRLEGASAQNFLDVVQNTIEKGFLMAPDESRKARRIIRKLSAACDMLPSAIFVSGVTGKDEHATFGGGYGDIYRAKHGDKAVA
ncbi:hypothetical protein C8R47DRAFT_609739 [Mycena vitilis]|nr:hypothetical protein C8R47DRAFT_609739 [Mycena vitilis]